MTRNLILIDNLGLSQEEFETIENLAALNYTPYQMAVYLEQDPLKFIKAKEVSSSKIQHHITAGRLRSQFLINEKLLLNAQSGNLTAVMLFEKAQDKNELEEVKKRILYGEG